MPKVIDFYLSTLNKHLQPENNPESKLSVIHQYLFLAGRENHTSEQLKALNKYQAQFDEILINIPASETIAIRHQRLILGDTNKSPIIPAAYFANDVVRFNELTASQSKKLQKNAKDILWHIDTTIYPGGLSNDQTLTDSFYIAYEGLLFNKTFAKGEHSSYLDYQLNPYGPYKTKYRFQPKLLNTRNTTAAILTNLKATPESTVKTETVTLDDGFEVEIEEEIDSANVKVEESYFKSAKSLTEQDLRDLTRWSGCQNPFGKYRGHRELDNGVRLLSHSGGFAVIFPSEIFYRFDIQVPIKIADNEQDNCTIAGAGYGYIKVDTNPNYLSAEEKVYIHPNVNIALDRIEQFYNENFINKVGLFPDSDYFTIGSYMTHPNDKRPNRIRMGGNYAISLSSDNPVSDFLRAASTHQRPKSPTFFTTADVVDGKFINIGGNLQSFSVMSSSNDDVKNATFSK